MGNSLNRLTGNGIIENKNVSAATPTVKIGSVVKNCKATGGGVINEGKVKISLDGKHSFDVGDTSENTEALFFYNNVDVDQT